MKRRLITAGLLAICFFAATLFAQTVATGTFEQEVVKAEFQEEGPQAEASFAQYPDATVRVFTLYGKASEFQAALHEFGHNQLVPILDKCLQTGDSFLEMGNAFNQIVGALTQLQWPKVERLTPEQCGARVILLTQSAKNDFLGQFAVNDKTGVAVRLPGSSVLAIAKGVVTSGLQNLERKLATDQDTTWRDWGGAALDVVAVAAAAKSVVVVARARIAARTARSAGEANAAIKLEEARGGLLAFAESNAPRIVKYATIGGIGYLAIYHPGVISGAVRTIAQIFGIDPFLLQVIVWTLILFLPLWLFVNFFTVLALFAKALSWLVRKSFAGLLLLVYPRRQKIHRGAI